MSLLGKCPAADNRDAMGFQERSKRVGVGSDVVLAAEA